MAVSQYFRFLSCILVIVLMYNNRNTSGIVRCTGCDAILKGGKRLSRGLVRMVTSPLMICRLHEAASFYQRALLANALTSALRLHQRLPHFQLSRAFLAQALLEDSCHYLLYSLIFVNSYPVTSILYLCHPGNVFTYLQNLLLFITCDLKN